MQTLPMDTKHVQSPLCRTSFEAKHFEAHVAHQHDDRPDLMELAHSVAPPSHPHHGWLHRHAA